MFVIEMPCSGCVEISFHLVMQLGGYIYPELRIEDYRFGEGKGVGSLC